MKRYALVGLLLLGSCTVGPDYQIPEQTHSTWATPFGNEAEIAFVRKAWWNYLEDEQLIEYLEQAAFHNYDIKQAEANIVEARGSKRVAAAAYFPHINNDFLAGRVGPSQSGFLPGLPLINGLQPESIFTFFFDCLWEIDLFGKTKRSVEAARARIESAVEQRNNLLITIQAEVAKNYIALRGTQEKIRLTQENIALLNEKSELIKTRMAKGLDDAIQYEQIASEKAQYESNLPTYYADFYAEAFSLSVLVGKPPEALLDELFPPKPLPATPEHLLLSARSELLQNRPDVRRAERELAAATADVGVAYANLFPSFSFAGLLGLDSRAIHNLFEWHSKAWALAGNVATPIFQGGALRGNLQKKRADLEKAAAQYQQTVLSALQEAETSLTSFLQDTHAEKLIKITTDHQRNIVALTKKRHIRGLDNQLQLINAKTALIGSEISLVNSQVDSLTQFIALYKALGGAWDAREN